jgi:hypothetical protein
MSHEAQKFAMVTAFAFIVPVIGYLAGVTWTSFVTRVFGAPPDPRVRRFGATFFLGLPIFLWISYVRLDFDNLGEWWSQSPVTVSLLGVVFLVLMPALLVWRIVAIWRSRETMKLADVAAQFKKGKRLLRGFFCG